MSRRSTPQHQIDERAFPVRVVIKVPESGMGLLLDGMTRWLHANVGRAEYAQHGGGTRHFAGDVMAFYFRTVEAAQAMVDAFPALELADGLDCSTYTSPVRSAYFYEQEGFGVCNLYSQTKGQQAIVEVTKAMKDVTGNLPPLAGIYPDNHAPVVRNTPEGRELAMLRWGMPSPAFVLKNRKVDRGVTNVRNTQSPHWRRWLGIEARCVVPFSSFSEYQRQPDGSSKPVWFALDESGPLAFFAGIWTEWTSTRKLKEGETTDNLFAFLTCEANDVVRPIHAKAMPVILTEPDEVEHWLTAPTKDALALQRPLPEDRLTYVGTQAL